MGLVKRIAGIFLTALIIIMMFAGTFTMIRADETYTVYVAGNAMTASGKKESWYTEGSVVTSKPASWSAHLYLDTAANLTLEINNLTAAGKKDDTNSKAAGIYTTNALTIKYSGTNKITGSTISDYNANPNTSFQSYDISYGIYANGLTLVGDKGDVLDVSASEVKGSSYGIYSAGALTAQGEGSIISEGKNTIDISANWNFSSVGIYAANTMTLKDGVNIKAIGGEAYAIRYLYDWSAGIVSLGDLTISDCTVNAISNNKTTNGTFRRVSRGLYAQDGDITITNSDVRAIAGDAAGAGSTLDISVGLLVYNGNITINSGTVYAESGDNDKQYADPIYGICARQAYYDKNNKNTDNAKIVINGGNVTGIAGTSKLGDSCSGIYAYNGIEINGGTVTGKSTHGKVAIGIESDWDLVVKNDAKVYATGGTGDLYSYGIKVWNNYYQSGNSEVHAFANNTTGTTELVGNKHYRRSYGFYMGDGYLSGEKLGNENTFTITYGIFEAASLADENSTTIINNDPGGMGGTEYALKFFDVKDDTVTFSDSLQPNAQWYWWTLDSNHAKKNINISTSKEYIYDDSEHNYLSKYLYIAPIANTPSEDPTTTSQTEPATQQPTTQISELTSAATQQTTKPLSSDSASYQTKDAAVVANTKKQTVTKTGDKQIYLVYISLTAAAALILVITIYYRKRENNKKSER